MSEEMARSVMENSARIEENEQRVFVSGWEQGELEGWQEGYNNGYDEGYASGFPAGEESGFKVGYEQGELEGWQEGYSDGYNNGFDEGYASGFPAGEERGIVEGKKQGAEEEYDRFWDELQPKGNGASSYGATFGQAWTKEIFKPKYNITLATANSTFLANRIGGDLVGLMEELGKALDFSQCTNCNSTFLSSTFTRIGKIYCSSSSWYNTFSGCSNLETIDEWGHPNASGTIAGDGLMNTFNGCTKLAHITVKGIIVDNISLRWCPLTKESIKSVVNALSTTTTWRTLTLSAETVNKAFAGGSTGSEWQSLIATKSNWTISLV